MTDEQQGPQMHFAQDDETEKLKQWWKRNGTGIVAGIVIGVGGVSGIQGWRMYQDYQANQASALYQQMLGAASGVDTGMTTRAAEALISDHATSGYADIARLMLARLAVDAGDLDTGKEALNGLLSSSSDPVMRHAARVRLAVLALQDGNPEQIKALAAQEDSEGFVSHYQELLGDALAESGQWEAAREAYQQALVELTPESPAAQLLNAKLNMTRKGDGA